MAGRSELQIFDGVSPQIVVDSALFYDVHPTTSLRANSNVVEFNVSSSTEEYLDLNDSLLYVKFRVVDYAGNAFSTQDTIPCNYLMNALFSDVSLALNDTVIEGGYRLYPYKATMEDMFHFSEDTKRIQLRPKGFCLDENERAKWVEKSRFTEVVGNLHLDFFNQPKYIIPGVNVNLRFVQSDNSFCFLNPGSPKNPKIELEKMIFYVRRVKVAAAVSIAHEIGLKKHNALYPYQRSEITSQVVGAGMKSFLKENPFKSSLLPKFVVIGMVNATAGDYWKDPFKFEHFNVKSVALYKNGKPLPDRQIYQPNFKEKRVTVDYVKSMLQNTEMLNTNLSHGIGIADWKENMCFFTFNLTPDFSMTTSQLKRDGTLRLEIEFSDKLKAAVNVLIYGIFDAELQITEERAIIIDQA